MIKKCNLLLFFFLLSTIPVLSAENMNNWKYSTLIENEGENRYKAIFLPDAIYSHALPSLADLRILDAAGNHVPFYIQAGEKTFAEAETIYSSKVVDTFIKDNHTYIDYKIEPQKINRDISGNALRFQLPDSNFLRHIQVYGSYDGVNWDIVMKDYVFKEGNNKKDEVTFPQKKKYTYYRIIVMDNIDKINLANLQLVDYFANLEWKTYLRITKLPFELTTDKKESVLTLHNNNQLRIRQILLEANGNFQRYYAVFNDKVSQYPLKTGEVYNLQLESTNISDTNISLLRTPTNSQLILIKIYNRDDHPLVFNDVSIEYFVDKIVFPDNGGGPYTLYFGNNSAKPPSYEIQLQKEYIEKEDQDICVLSDTQPKNEKTTDSFGSLDMKSVFNIILIAVSIFLSGLLIIKLGKKAE